MRVRVSHHGPVSPDGWARDLRCRQVHRVPVLRMGLPGGLPTAEWDSLAPKIQKCTHCSDRADQPPLARNGVALTPEEVEQHMESTVSLPV